jgi:protein TonB
MDGIDTMREIRRSITPYPGKWFGISLGIHLIAYALMAALSSKITPPKAPVIIDLTFDSGVVAKDVASPRRQPLVSATAAATPHPSPAKPVEARQSVADLPSPAPVPAPASVALGPGVRDSLPLKAQGDGNANAPAGRPGNTAAGATHKEPVAQVAATGHGDATPEKAKQRYLTEHFMYIRDLVMKSLVYPHQARKMGWSGKVTVSFLVCEDGSAREVKVVESSGHPMLDRCAIETIRKVAPFPKPPLQAEIVIPVLFKLM